MPQEFDLAPGGAELWNVDGTMFLVYTVPTADPPVYMTWRVRDDEALKAHLPSGDTARPDRTLTREQFRQTGALDFGFSDELRNFNDHPFSEFEQSHEQEAAVQPWLNDPEVLAIVTAAMLEGRAPTTAELSSTDYFQDRSASEIQWLVDLATDPQAARDRRADFARAVTEMLRGAGVSDAPDAVVNLLAERWVSGRWSESFVASQVRGLADPFSEVELQGEVVQAARDFDPRNGDAGALAAGRDGIRARLEAMFTNRGIDPTVNADGTVEPGRMERLADEVAGGRSLDDVRRALDRQAGLHPLTGRDVTRAGEDAVRQQLEEWLGPMLSTEFDDTWVRRWAGRLRNDPDAQTELTETLQRLSRANFPEWGDQPVRYADVAPTAKQLFRQVWQQTPQETDPLFMDILRMAGPGGEGLAAAATRLREKGWEQGVAPVVEDATRQALAATGGQIRRAV